MPLRFPLPLALASGAAIVRSVMKRSDPQRPLLRAIPPSMDAETVAAIDSRLDGVERDHGVTIALAIESGSRAWGFPSPDSDYDCRFVFVRPPDHYMTLFPRRDVIETPLTEVFDVNGWDIAKALKLLLAGNAVIVEWLTSPIVYRADEAFRDSFLQLAGMTADRSRIAQHYLHLGRSILTTRLGDLGDVPLKKLFYALRPAVALRWMRLHPVARLPPMHFPTLCAEAALAQDLDACIQDMLARKAVTRELGRGPMPALIQSAILAEFDEADAAFAQREARDQQDEEHADAFFRDWVARYAAIPLSREAQR
jgi:predicted nucleotidyltransferase